MIHFKERENLTLKINNLQKKTKIFSGIRFIIALFAIFFIICFLSLELFATYLVLSLVAIGCLILLILFTNPYYHQLKLLRQLEFVYQSHDRRRDGNYQGFADDGRQFVSYEDYKQLDLDLLGPKSLYQYLCLAKTKLGREALAKQLTNPDSKSIEFRNCVAALAVSEKSLELEASLLNISKDSKDCDVEELIGLAHEKTNLSNYIFGWMILGYSIVIATIVFLVLNHLNPLYALPTLAINFFLTYFFSKNKLFGKNVTKYNNLIHSYTLLSKDILNINIEDPYFKELQMVIQSQLESLIHLKKAFEWLSSRKNIIFYILGNTFFFMDFWIAKIYDSKTKKVSSVEETFSVISEIEVMLSLAVIGMDHECYTKGEIGNKFYIEDGYHPLVKKCVSNSFVLDGGVILTGSNMSGKTTFQRMVGINQILFNAGGLVCAKYFSAPFLNIVTSLRANDMLQEGISTFYAEIKRMKTIMTTCKNQKNTLVLIDEIFKGTNAKDRIYASLEIIRSLQDLNVLFIITTHDFELCEAKDILNFHFDETFDNDEIHFDYKIKEGRSTKTNALYLLRMSGVLEDLK